MSTMNAVGLNIHVFKPNIVTTPAFIMYPEGQYLKTLVDGFEGYTHTISAIGGYQSASFALKGHIGDVEEWIAEGLARHIVVFDSSGFEIWEGFVNAVTLTAGPFSVVRGPLIDVGNRVMVTYTTVDNSTMPPTTGIQAETVLAENIDSQALYGVIEKVLAAGELDNSPGIDEADQLRDMFLADNAWPATTKQITMSDSPGEMALVTIECLGYAAYFDLYIYNQIINNLTYTAYEKLADVLDADPNSLFSSANADLTFNPVLEPQYEDQNKTAWTIIKNIMSKGGPTLDRWLFGVYNQRRIAYGPASVLPEYQQRIADPMQRITTMGGAEVWPWAVRPGKWLLLPDFLIGRISDSIDRLRLDPRMLFIESVTYTAPFGLGISGGKSDKISQMLAQLGMGVM